MIKNLFQATLVTLFVYILNKNIKRVNLLMVYLLSFVFFSFTDKIQLNTRVQENFFNADNKRGIRFGDKISIYLPDIQHYVGVNKNNVKVYNETTGGEIKKTNEVVFTVENPYEPIGPGNNNYVQLFNPQNFNKLSVLCFRTVDNKYLGYQNQKFVLYNSTQRTADKVGFVLQSTVNEEGGGGIIKYGDLIFITQLGNNNTLHYNTTNIGGNVNIFNFKPDRKNDRSEGNKFQIRDHYGEGLKIDWAKRSLISAVSTNEDPRNLVDGFINTSVISGGNEKGEIEVVFPKNIYIEQCQFYIIRGQDSNQSSGSGEGQSLSEKSEKFNIKLYDSAGTLLVNQSQYVNGKSVLPFEVNDKKWVWDNVATIAKSMVIEKIGDKKELGFSLIKVFGEPVEHSVLLEKPSLVDVYSGRNNEGKSVFGGSGGNNKAVADTFIKADDELPYTVRDMTLSFWFNHNIDNKDKKVELIKKGTGDIVNKSLSEQQSGSNNVINLTPSIFLEEVRGGRKLVAVVTSNNKLQDSIDSDADTPGSSKEIIKPNENYHVAVVIRHGMKKSVGWHRVDFFPTGNGYYDPRSADGIKHNPKGLDIALNNGLEKGSYMYNRMTNEYYVIPSGIMADTVTKHDDFSSDAGILTINKSPRDLNAIYKGVLKMTNIESNMMLYINGKEINNVKLSNFPIYNRNAMVIGGDSKYKGYIYDVKYANYSMNEEQLRLLSMKKTSNVVKRLYPKGFEGGHLFKGFRTTVTEDSTGKKVTKSPLMSIPHINLPEYNKQFTLGFWLYTNPLPPGSSLTETVFKKGNIVLDRNSDGKLKLSIGNTVLPDIVVPNKRFVHICLVYGSDLLDASGDLSNLRSYKFNLYINGNIQEDARLFKGNVYELTVKNTDFLREYDSLQFGNFNGEIGKMMFSNYAFNINEIRDMMGEHPHSELNQQLTKLFREGGECSGIPYDLHLNPDSEDANLVKKLYKNDGEDGNNEPRLPEIKVELDKIKNMATLLKDGKDLPDDADRDAYKNAYRQCYRSDLGDVLGGEQQDVNEATIHAEQKCLARAPNVCPPEKTIADFDISEHPDFFKAVKPSDVNKCPTLVENKNINNFNLEELKKHKNFKTLKQSIENNINLGAVIDGINDSNKLKSIVEKIVKSNKVELADILGSSSTSPQASGVSGAIMDGISTGSIDPSEIMSNLSPSEITNIVTKVIKKGDLPVNKLLSILRDNQLIGNICKSGIQSGSINPSDLSSGNSSMNASLASKCKEMDIKLHPQYTKHFNKALEEKLKKLNILKSDKELKGLDLSDYIHKDDIPCVGCKIGAAKDGVEQAKSAAKKARNF